MSAAAFAIVRPVAVAPADDDLATLKAFYARTRAAYEASGYYARLPLNEFWASINMQTMRGLIEGAQSFTDLVHGAQRTMMFSVNVADDSKERAVDWLLRERMARMSCFPMAAGIEESEHSLPENNAVRIGRRYSPDFLRCVNIGARINMTCGAGLDVVELGGGCGHLARVLKLSGVARRHIIIDLPETLCFSYAFLRLNFPDARMVLAEEDTYLGGDDYDFAFVPALLEVKALARPCDLFLNTASMGEMRNEVIRHWMGFIQGALEPRYLFTLNRYLNTIHDGLRWRLAENECSVHYDALWKVLAWDLEPSYTRCPYVDTRVSRYVEIIAERLDAPESPKAAMQALDDVRAEDWWRLRHEGHVMGMRDNPVCVDGGMDGTLFRLWNALRVCPSREAVDMMLLYLSRLLRDKATQFEEVTYYLALRGRLA